MNSIYISKKEMVYKLIAKAFNLNLSIPHGYGTRGYNYRKAYAHKERLISNAIKIIKKYHLNIKYGIKFDYIEYVSGLKVKINPITYFEIKGRQFSFHGHYGTVKEYNGEWNKVCHYKGDFILNCYPFKYRRTVPKCIRS